MIRRMVRRWMIEREVWLLAKTHARCLGSVTPGQMEAYRKLAEELYPVDR